MRMAKSALVLILALGLGACASALKQTPAGSPMRAPYNAELAALESEDWDEPPKLLQGSPPVYPISKVLDGSTGQATVTFTINLDGTTSDFKVVAASVPVFGDHAVIAVRDWRFAPARKRGQPISVEVEQTFNFMR